MKDHTFSLSIITLLLFVIAAHFVGLKTVFTVLAVGVALVVLLVLLTVAVAAFSAWFKYRQNRKMHKGAGFSSEF